MRLFEHEREIRQLLDKASIDSPALCARVLTAYAAGLEKTGYILARDEHLPKSRAILLRSLAQRRAKGEPLAYILGNKEFYGRDFFINPSSLIPRPESELLIDLILDKCPNTPLTFADLGSGSGCLGITLLLERSAWRGFMLDINWDTLVLARKNARKFHCNPVILNGDIFAPPFKPHALDLIISNPPYISYSEIDSVMNETLAFEPHCALFSKNGGYAHLQAVIEMGTSVLKPDGWLILEHGFAQKPMVKELLKKNGYQDIAMHDDLANLPRYCMAKLKRG